MKHHAVLKRINQEIDELQAISDLIGENQQLTAENEYLKNQLAELNKPKNRLPDWLIIALASSEGTNLRLIEAELLNPEKAKNTVNALIGMGIIKGNPTRQLELNRNHNLFNEIWDRYKKGGK